MQLMKIESPSLESKPKTRNLEKRMLNEKVCTAQILSFLHFLFIENVQRSRTERPAALTCRCDQRKHTLWIG